MSYVLVAIGGAIGAAMRHGVNRLAWAQSGSGFPAATLTVNVSGSVLMGIAAGIFMARGGGAEGWKLFVTTGLLGGFTTFSAFSLEAVQLWQRGEHASLGVYLVASVALSIGGLLAGLALTQGLLGLR